MHTDQDFDLAELIKNQGFANIYAFCKMRLRAWLRLQIELCIMPYQQIQFEEMLAGLEKEDWEKEILAIIKKLGYDFEKYAQEEICLWWKEKIRHYELLIRYYQQKYGVETYEEASARFHEYDFDTIVKEDDIWAWEEATEWIDSYVGLTKTFEKL